MRLRWWRARELVCREAVALVTDYVEGRLSARDVARLERHLAACPNCSEYFAQIRVTIDALGHIEPEDLSGDALDELVELYQRWQAD